jgi:hypothetical protein
MCNRTSLRTDIFPTSGIRYVPTAREKALGTWPTATRG